jgi:hypothetical protein
LAEVIEVLRYSSAQFGLFKTDILRSTGGIRPYYYSDRVLLLEIALRGKIVEANDHPLFYYRRHPSQSNGCDTAKGQLKRPRLYREYCRAIERAPLTQTERLRCFFELSAIWIRRKFRPSS